MKREGDTVVSFDTAEHVGLDVADHQWGKLYPRAVACLEDDFEALTTRLRFPKEHRAGLLGADDHAIDPEWPRGHAPRVEGARVGDAVALHVETLEQLSRATTSGTHTGWEGRYISDPFVANICPTCRDAGRHFLYPDTYLDGLGEGAVRCSTCHSEVMVAEAADQGLAQLAESAGKRRSGKARKGNRAPRCAKQPGRPRTARTATSSPVTAGFSVGSGPRARSRPSSPWPTRSS